jgi:hypothetical protein
LEQIPSWIECNLIGVLQSARSVLGPFFRPTTLPEDPRVTAAFFQNPTLHDQDELLASVSKLQGDMNQVCGLFVCVIIRFVLICVAVSPLLAWIAVA